MFYLIYRMQACRIRAYVCLRFCALAGNLTNNVAKGVALLQLQTQPQGLVDLHTHLLPYVDDGAQTLAEAQALLAAQAAQGVGTICLTPHWRAGMFETPAEKINQQYARLTAYVASMPQPIALRLGREYYCDTAFLKLLAAGQVQPIQGTNSVLIEFSPTRHTAEHLCASVCALRDAGFTPIVAHVERYKPVRDNPHLLQQLTALGAYCQMNAEGVLGKMGLREKWFCLRLLRQQSEHIALIASDSHRTVGRTPNLGDCAAYLQKKLPPAQWQALFVENPKKLLALAE